MKVRRYTIASEDRIRDEADKFMDKHNRALEAKMNTTRMALSLLEERAEKLRLERRKLIALADKTMTHERIGSALGLTKQRVSKILAARQKEGRSEEVDPRA